MAALDTRRYIRFCVTFRYIVLHSVEVAVDLGLRRVTGML